MSENGIDQETKNKLALMRACVRIQITKGAFIFLAIAALWNLTWQGDGTLALSIVGAALSWIGFWFGTRNKEQGN